MHQDSRNGIGDLFRDDDFTAVVVETLREGNFGPTRTGWIDGWEADPDSLDVNRFLSLVEDIGKGRFAQRLVSRIAGLEPPDFVREAIEFVSARV